MTILVTGGCGFVGRNLIKALLGKGFEVTCVDSMLAMTGCIEPTKWPEFSPLDFEKFRYINADCREFFQSDSTGFNEIYHLAAVVGGRLMIENNPLAVSEDLSIDALMFSWAKRTGVGKIINFSSSAAYPNALQRKDSFRLLKESDIDLSSEFIGMPDLTYGWAKLTAEFLGKIAYQTHGIKSVVYRPFSGYGPTQDLTYPFPSIVKRVVELPKGSKKMQVWGSGLQMRDFIHIEDCIQGVLLTKDRIEDGSAVNLSTGKLTSFLDFARICLGMFNNGNVVEVCGTSDKPEGVFARGGDVTLQEFLGFTEKRSLEKGISEGLQYFCSTISSRV